MVQRNDSAMHHLQYNDDRMDQAVQFHLDTKIPRNYQIYFQTIELSVSDADVESLSYGPY